VYSQEMLEFLKDGYKTMRVPELTAAFNQRFNQNKSRVAIKSRLTTNGFTCGRPAGSAKGERITLLTSEQIAFVEREYKTAPQRELLEKLNATFGISLVLPQLVAFLKNHNIRSGRTGCFEEGHVPHNTGTKGVMKPNSGSFQKGQRPKNYRPIGYERLCPKDGYVLVKVADNNPWDSSTSGWYRHKQQIVWEKHHGPVPEGSCIRFKDGDRTNVAIENLMLVTRGEHARLTQLGYSGQPDEIKPVVLGIAKLEQAVHEKSKAERR